MKLQDYLMFKTVLLQITTTFLFAFLLLPGTGFSESNIGLQLDLIDTTIQPEKDFYQFASGLWLNSAKRPESYGRYGYHNFSKNLVENDIVELLKGYDGKGSEVNSNQLVNLFYEQGMDTTTIELQNISGIRKQLNLIDNIDNLDDLQDVLAEFQLIGVNPFFGIHTPYYWELWGVNYLYLHQAYAGLNEPKQYTSESTVEIYRNYIVSTFKMIGNDDETAKNSAETVINIERQLAKKAYSKKRLNNFRKNYHEYTYNKLEKLVPEICWDDYFSSLGLEYYETVIIGNPGYFRAVGKLLRESELKDIKTYLHWRLLYKSSPYLSKEYLESFYNFKKETAGWQVEIPRDIMLHDIIRRDLSDVLSQLYTDFYYPKERKDKIDEMIDNLKSAFATRLKNNPWLSEDSKSKAIEKLNCINFKAGTAEKKYDYSNLKLYDTVFIQNLFTIRKHNWHQHFQIMGKDIDASEWATHPLNTNAWCGLDRNDVTITAASINTLFVPGSDDASNYGMLGSRIAHEITHGFDNTGMKYDKDGNYNNLFTRSDRSKFKKRAKLLAKQYNQYLVLDNYHVNGKKTLGENIADLGGLLIAYDAYKLSLDGVPSDTIDGYSGEQRFFIAYAQKWRELFDDRTLINSLNGWHSPPRYRTNGVVYNVPGFYEAFKLNGRDGTMTRPEDEVIEIW